jgi:hypothetical protein
MNRSKKRTLMNTRSLVLIALLFAFAPSPGLAQDDYWRLGESARELTEGERKDLEDLPSKLADLPKVVLKAFLKEEGKHLEALTKQELDAFSEEAKLRFKAHGTRHLISTLKVLFKSLGITSKRVLGIVIKEESKRLDDIPDRLFRSLLSEALKRVIGDRLKRLSHITLDVVKVNKILNGPKTNYGWKHGHTGNSGSDSRALRDFMLLVKEDKFLKTLYKKEFKGKFGTLNMKAANIEALSKIKAGKLSFKDEFGRVHEGFGAHFNLRTKLVVAAVDGKTERLNLLKSLPINISAMVLAKIIDIGTEAEIDAKALVSKDGLIIHNEVRAGATVKASVRMPIDFDLKLFKVRVTPYLEAHAGAGAAAHITLEIDWKGRFAIDIGAATSLGIGSGGGVRLEIMAGPLLEKLLVRIQRGLTKIFRPIFESLKGIREFGPAFENGKVTVSIEELESLAAPLKAPGTPIKVVQRYAPILYQRVKHTPHDFIRSVDFDGDFNSANNWDNSHKGDQKAYIYWDLKETKSHYFITYSWFYARRESGGLSFLRFINRHENDMAGVLVVVRKNAPPLHALEMVMSANGEQFHGYSPSKKKRWETDNFEASVDWKGTIKYIDEADHPFFDHHRTHPQVYSKARAHDVSIYNGRDDRDAFDGDDGVVYYPTQNAEAPESSKDLMVGYALKPLSELLANEERLGQLFSKDRIKVGPAAKAKILPRAFRGNIGANNSARPPWAWEHEVTSLDRSGSGSETVVVIKPGELFADPAGTLSRLYKIPGTFSKTYLRNEFLGVRSAGARGALEGSRGN